MILRSRGNYEGLYRRIHCASCHLRRPFCADPSCSRSLKKGTRLRQATFILLDHFAQVGNLGRRPTGLRTRSKTCRAWLHDQGVNCKVRRGGRTGNVELVARFWNMGDSGRSMAATTCHFDRQSNAAVVRRRPLRSILPWSCGMLAQRSSYCWSFMI